MTSASVVCSRAKSCGPEISRFSAVSRAWRSAIPVPEIVAPVYRDFLGALVREAHARNVQVHLVMSPGYTLALEGEVKQHPEWLITGIRGEIYRHLSNAADMGDEAANVIADIVVKMT